jgi:hypothetical protein
VNDLDAENLVSRATMTTGANLDIHSAPACPSVNLVSPRGSL